MAAARQLGGTLIESVGRRQVAMGEEFLQSAQAEPAGELTVLRQRAQFAGEGEEAAPAIVIERLLAEAVARQEEAAARAVVDGEGEHAVEAQGQRRAPFAVAMQQDFGVGVARAE